jgi:hypothetical protein
MGGLEALLDRVATVFEGHAGRAGARSQWGVDAAHDAFGLGRVPRLDPSKVTTA